MRAQTPVRRLQRCVATTAPVAAAGRPLTRRHMCSPTPRSAGRPSAQRWERGCSPRTRCPWLWRVRRRRRRTLARSGRGRGSAARPWPVQRVRGRDTGLCPPAWTCGVASGALGLWPVVRGGSLTRRRGAAPCLPPPGRGPSYSSATRCARVACSPSRSSFPPFGSWACRGASTVPPTAAPSLRSAAQREGFAPGCGRRVRSCPQAAPLGPGGGR